MNLIPIKNNSEDTADITLREYLCRRKKWKVAFYSPPCGSWSTIRLGLDNVIFETFSPRDIKRPDIVLYKVINDELNIMIIESKKSVSEFTRKSVLEYLEDMTNYGNKLISEKYRLVKNVQTGKFAENDTLPIEYVNNHKIHIGLLAATEKLTEDLAYLGNLVSGIDVSGVLVEVDWKNRQCAIQSVNDLTGQFEDNKLISYSY